MQGITTYLPTNEDGVHLLMEERRNVGQKESLMEILWKDFLIWMLLQEKNVVKVLKEV